ncbi:MAG: hypothetical protein A2283_04225 [Lentisphaerae bacterium RIFOXYA12_FULL_48_11]|nr:MAG: hypothetical protein A2283_04225 [Lentisphaerae bacterium RIFOXYA12_FULL_48_11]
MRFVLKSHPLFFVIAFSLSGCVSAELCTSLENDIVIETAAIKAVLGPDAVWKSLVHKCTGRDLIIGKTKFAAATFGQMSMGHRAGIDDNVIHQQRVITDAATKKRIEASRACLKDGRLIVGFNEFGCDLSYDVSECMDGIIFKLNSISGQRPHELELVRIAVTPVEHVGRRLAAGWDSTIAVGLTAVNLQVQAYAQHKKGQTFISASTQDYPGPRLEGAGVALIAAPPPEYRATLCRLSAELNLVCNLGGGVPSKELPVAKESYWFLNFGEADVDKVIECCKQSGFRQVLLSSSSWCTSPGHYVFNTKMFPEGQASLRRTVTKLHKAGIKVGMHGFASKIAKIDPYVTPVPDKRFWVDRENSIASDIDAFVTEIRVKTDLREWPGSSIASQKMWEGGVEKHREVIVDNEIIQYKSIGPEGKWNTFQDCRRGAFKTLAVGHKAGSFGRHFGVDGCIDGYIIDQETGLLDEVTTRLAGIFNDCDFDMFYFDGGEDVDRRRFAYYVSKFQLESIRKFTKRPIIHMGTIMTHNLWHSFSRSGTVDTYMNTLNGHIIAGGKAETWPTVRQHIDKSVEYMLSISEDMMPGELGWFGIWPKSKNTDGLQLDEIEYLMTKSMAYDVPVSLQTSFGQMDKHPFTPGILEIVKVYEDARMMGVIPVSETAKLRQKGVDFAIIRNGNEWQFVRLDAPSRIGGVKVSVGAYGQGSVVVVWGCEQDSKLILPVGRESLNISYIRGEEVEVDSVEGQTEINLGPRRITIIAPQLTVAKMKELIGNGYVKGL